MKISAAETSTIIASTKSSKRLKYSNSAVNVGTKKVMGANYKANSPKISHDFPR